MEKADSYTERIETMSNATPPLTGTEKNHDNVSGAHFEVDETSLPPGYFTSKFFLGSMAGIALGLMAGVVRILQRSNKARMQV